MQYVWSLSLGTRSGSTFYRSTRPTPALSYFRALSRLRPVARRLDMKRFLLLTIDNGIYVKAILGTHPPIDSAPSDVFRSIPPPPADVPLTFLPPPLMCTHTLTLGTPFPPSIMACLEDPHVALTFPATPSDMHAHAEIWNSFLPFNCGLSRRPLLPTGHDNKIGIF